mgnify:CR=1 FL=1
MIRADEQDLIYKSADAKWDAVAEDVAERPSRPLLDVMRLAEDRDDIACRAGERRLDVLSLEIGIRPKQRRLIPAVG